ncbi:hypothetical protein FRB93_004303 [Tulasnella sp. JGI-2019a]|nr:hypothetical protein FRB93_004303 [Tulasnella sp. JGI-2019a]
MSYVLDRLPRFSYNASRDFHGRWFIPLVIIASTISLCILIPINFALTGYETLSVFQSDFSKVPDLWFWRFGNKPESVCDPRTLNAGDTFITNRGLLTWTIDTIFEEPPLDLYGNETELSPVLPRMRYSGHSLDNCDIMNLAVSVNSQALYATFNANVICNDADFPVLMRTSYFTDFLGDNSQSISNTLSSQAAMGESRVDLYLGHAAFDVWSGLNVPTSLFSLYFPNVLCHTSQLGMIDPSCTAVPVNIDDVYTTLSTATLSSFSDAYSSDTYSTGVQNAVQLLIAIVRLDLGSVFSNNFFVYPNVLDATISSNTTLYQTLQSNNSTLPGLGDTSRPAVIDSQYLCHVPQRKPIGSIIATLGTFVIGWVAFFLVIAYYERRKPKQVNVNSCDCRLPEYESVKRGDIQKVADESLSQERGDKV